MREIETYPKMNEMIRDLLEIDKGDHVSLYAKARIEELETENREMKYYIKNGIELGYIDDREGNYKKYIYGKE